MKSKQALEEYLLAHPGYWEFEEELAEVKRLKAECEKEKRSRNYTGVSSFQTFTASEAVACC